MQIQMVVCDSLLDSRNSLKRCNLGDKKLECAAILVGYGAMARILEMRTDLESLNGAYDEKNGLGREVSGEQTQQILVRNIVPEYLELWGFPGDSVVKNPACQCRRYKRCGFDPWVGKIPWRGGMATDSSTLAWRVPWMEKPGGLQPTGSQKSRTQHNNYGLELLIPKVLISPYPALCFFTPSKPRMENLQPGGELQPPVVTSFFRE